MGTLISTTTKNYDLAKTIQYTRAGFLKLCAMDILGWTMLCGEHALCSVISMAVSLASTHWMPVASPSSDNPKCLQIAPNVQKSTPV